MHAHTYKKLVYSNWNKSVLYNVVLVLLLCIMYSVVIIISCISYEITYLFPYCGFCAVYILVCMHSL